MHGALRAGRGRGSDARAGLRAAHRGARPSRAGDCGQPRHAPARPTLACPRPARPPRAHPARARPRTRLPPTDPTHARAPPARTPHRSRSCAATRLNGLTPLQIRVTIGNVKLGGDTSGAVQRLTPRLASRSAPRISGSRRQPRPGPRRPRSWESSARSQRTFRTKCRTRDILVTVDGMQIDTSGIRTAITATGASAIAALTIMHRAGHVRAGGGRTAGAHGGKLRLDRALDVPQPARRQGRADRHHALLGRRSSACLRPCASRSCGFPPG